MWPLGPFTCASNLMNSAAIRAENNDRENIRGCFVSKSGSECKGKGSDRGANGSGRKEKVSGRNGDGSGRKRMESGCVDNE